MTDPYLNDNRSYPKDEAILLTKIMMAAEIAGNNQGISKLYDAETNMKFNHEAAAPLSIERESPLAAVVSCPRISATG